MQDDKNKGLLNTVLSYAETQPDKIALKFLEEDYINSQTLTYKQLSERILTLANSIVYLQNKTSEKPKLHQPIMLIFDSSIEYIITFFAVLYTANIAITVYPPRQVRHLQRLINIIEDAQAEIIITTSKIRDFCHENQFQFPQQTSLMCVDELENVKANELPVADPDDIAFLQYTSGSTGIPKGVMVTHKNICANINLIAGLLGRKELERGVAWTPIFHDLGLIGNTLSPLYLGGTCIFMSPLTFLKKPLFWLQAISQEKATFSMAPNFAYDLAAKAFEKNASSISKLDFSTVCHLMNGAEPPIPETVRNFEKLLLPYGLKKNVIKTGYGLAETTLCISVETSPSRFVTVDKKSLENGFILENSDPQNSAELVSCGSITSAYKAKIVDPNTFKALPVNTIGELWVQGDSVAAGYYKNHEKTDEMFKAFTSDTKEGPFLRTGDLGFLNPHGKLIICGRVKDLIIINGRNIYPLDVEITCYQSNPAIIANAAAVFSIQNDIKEEVCVLVAEVADNLDDAAYQAILNQIRKAVFEYNEIILHDILLIPPRKILKTSSGKIQRSACKKTYLQGGFEFIARLQQTEVAIEKQSVVKQPTEQNADLIRWLKKWVSNQANIAMDQIDINRAFAEYGLTSVQLVAMIGELEEVTQQSLDPWLAWEFPTILNLSQRLVPEKPPQETEEISHYEPIAVIGIDCLLPGKNYQNINGVEETWNNLKDNNDNIEPIPLDHWDNRLYFDPDRDKKGYMYCSEGGFLSDIKRFDAKFFNISPREAAYLDPQQRLLLTVTWHALEDAGVTVENIKNSKTGIYMGMSTHDYDQLIQKYIPLQELSAYQATGTSFSTAAGRLAYFLGTQGPCMAIDTACSSSLVTIHQACRSLQDGDCQLAIAGGVNLILSPEGNIIFCKSNMLSPRSRCSTFDIAADGYVRGEGCGVVILKKLSDAIRDGNKIYAVIHGSAVNQDGASNGLTAPNLNAQIDVIKTALQRAHLQPHQITHVEAHGTGTELGDPIEWEGIRRTYGFERKNPLYITSLKTRIGHLEAAAGVAGFIKTALAIKHRQIPAHLHLKQFNPKLHQQDNMLVPRELTSWEVEKRYAGVSSFGFSGTNAHIILGEAPTTTQSEEKILRPDHLWVISAQDKAALNTYIKNYFDYGMQPDSVSHFASFSHHMLTRRTHLPYRAFVVAKNKTEWLEKLKNKDWQEDRILDTNRMAWLFTGQGSLQPHVAAKLYETLPQFAALLEQCCKLTKKWLPYDLREILLNTPTSVDINHTTYAQPALFVFEYCLARWLLNLGLRPAFLLGHSLGEYVAACIADVMTLEDALLLVCKRAMLFSKLPNNGAMLAIAATLSKVESFIKQDNRLVIALKNGPKQIVVSGTNEAIAACQAYCEKNNLRCKKIATSHAFHSPLIEPIADEFEEIAKTINYKSANIPIISNLTGREIQNGQINASYWREHMLKTVEFQQGLETIQQNGVDIFIEIGPKPLLISQMQETNDWLTLSTISDAKDPWPGLLQTLGTLYLRGVDINWFALNKHYTVAEENLLKYPFMGKEYWLPAEFLNKDTSISREHPSTPNINEETLDEVQHKEVTQVRPEDILKIAQKILGIAPNDMSIKDNWFEFGLDSIMAAQLTQQINQKYKKKYITAKDIFAHFTAEELANKILTKIEKNNDLQRELTTQENILPYYDASVLQDNLWRLFKNHPNKMPYYVPIFKNLDKSVDLQRLNFALLQTIKNNPALRVSFTEHDESIKWQLHQDAKASIQIIKTKNMLEKIDELLVEPIDLNQPPLLKVYLLQTDQENNEQILMIRIHHLICDGTSAERFLNEFESWYDGTEVEIISNDKDVYYLNQAQLEKANYDKNLKSYIQHIDKLNPHLVDDDWIPQGCQEINYLGSVVYQHISKKLSDKIISFCQKNHFSPYFFYLYMFCKMLSSVVKKNKVYLSMAKSNRQSLAYQNMIGYYADNIPIFVEINPTENAVSQIQKLQMHIMQLIEQYPYPILFNDLEHINYKKPPFLFNQYKEVDESKLFIPADHLIYKILERGANKVTLWDYSNHEKLYLLARSSSEGDFLYLIFNTNFFNENEAKSFLEKMMAEIKGLFESDS